MWSVLRIPMDNNMVVIWQASLHEKGLSNVSCIAVVNMLPRFEWQTTLSQSACRDEAHHSSVYQICLSSESPSFLFLSGKSHLGWLYTTEREKRSKHMCAVTLFWTLRQWAKYSISWRHINWHWCFWCGSAAVTWQTLWYEKEASFCQVQLLIMLVLILLSDECRGDEKTDDHTDGARHGGVAQGQYVCCLLSVFLFHRVRCFKSSHLSSV